MLGQQAGSGFFNIIMNLTQLCTFVGLIIVIEL
jgi:hypothetical protein